MVMSKLISTMLSTITQDTIFPLHAENRSMANRKRCTLTPPGFLVSASDGALGCPRTPSGYRGLSSLARYLNIALYDVASGVRMLTASDHGKIFWAHAFCEFRI